MVYKTIDLPIEIRAKEQMALEIKQKTGVEIRTDLPQFISAQSVVIKSSYLLFPIQGQDNVLYIDKSNKQIYIYDIDTMQYQAIVQNLKPMTDEEVKNMVDKIKGVD